MENKKYEFTGETLTFDTGVPYEYYDDEIDDDVFEYEQTTLHRIKAIKDFGNVHAGDLGGFIEKEENLSQDGDCWVAENAQVYDDAKVYDNAVVAGDAKIHGNARVYDDAEVSGDAQIYDRARVYGYAQVYMHAKVSGDAEVYDVATVGGRVQVLGNSQIFETAVVTPGDDTVIVDATLGEDTVIR